MRRLVPGPLAEVTVDEAAAADRRRWPDGRPWVEVCMVTSIDGATVVDGRSGGLSGATDQRMLAALRRHADVVLVGAGTARAEGYGPPSRADLRIGVVTRSGRLDLSAPLFASGAGFLVMPEDGPDLPVETVRAGRATVDLAAAVRRLPGDPSVVHMEGGPELNGAALQAGLVDELNVTVSPVLVGGEAPRLAVSPDAASMPMALAQALLDDDGFLFCRWVRAGSAG